MSLNVFDVSGACIKGLFRREGIYRVAVGLWEEGRHGRTRHIALAQHMLQQLGVSSLPIEKNFRFYWFFSFSSSDDFLKLKFRSMWKGRKWLPNATKFFWDQLNLISFTQKPIKLIIEASAKLRSWLIDRAAIFDGFWTHFFSVHLGSILSCSLETRAMTQPFKLARIIQKYWRSCAVSIFHILDRLITKKANWLWRFTTRLSKQLMEKKSEAKLIFSLIFFNYVQTPRRREWSSNWNHAIVRRKVENGSGVGVAVANENTCNLKTNNLIWFKRVVSDTFNPFSRLPTCC